MDESIFDLIDTVDIFDYKFYLKDLVINNNFCRFYIIIGTYPNGYLDLLQSNPSKKDLPLSSYIEVIVQTSGIYNDSYKKYETFSKDYVKQYKMPMLLAEEFLNMFLENSVKNNIPQPCCKCKLNDKWNSLGKDNKWYCYQHCSY